MYYRLLKITLDKWPQRTLQKELNSSYRGEAGTYKRLEGLEFIDKAILIDRLIKAVQNIGTAPPIPDVTLVPTTPSCLWEIL